MPRGHRCAAVGVNRQTVWINLVRENCFPDKHGGERTCFAAGEPPSNNTSALQVKNDVEVVIDADYGRKLNDVPSLDLVWSCRTKSWDPRLRMRRDVAMFSNRLVLPKYSIHRSRREKVSALG